MVLNTVFFAWLAALVTVTTALFNPIIPGWNPDPHVLRVDDTYYIATSSFLVSPGIPIYQSRDLANWELVAHALNKPGEIPLTGVREGNGVWAPSLSYIDGKFYATSMSMSGSDPSYYSWPRMFWVSSADLETWSDVVWAEPYGIDPHLFKDPVSNQVYLTIMGLNNGYDKLWGISQCQVNLDSGKCLGPFRNIWNGTLDVTTSTRPEGPKLFYKDGFYYLLIAEGGTGASHRATIARSKSPDGPWESSPTNPLLFNGADAELTVGATGHATFADRPDGRWFCTFLATRTMNGSSPLGRETFYAPVEWREDGWPVVNGGEYIKLSQEYDDAPSLVYPKVPYEDHFNGCELDKSWYQLFSPYTQNYYMRCASENLDKDQGGGVILVPNVYTLSDRDTPAAILRKQTSINMTFEATLVPTNKSLGPYQSVGISAWAADGNHHDIGIRGCANITGQCIFVDSSVDYPGPLQSPVTVDYEISSETIPIATKLYIRSQPGMYSLGYSIGNATINWVKDFSPRDLPAGFDGAMFALFASGNTFPWPFDAPEVGFLKIREEYFEEGYTDYQD